MTCRPPDALKRIAETRMIRTARDTIAAKKAMQAAETEVRRLVTLKSEHSADWEAACTAAYSDMMNRPLAPAFFVGLHHDLDTRLEWRREITAELETAEAGVAECHVAQQAAKARLRGAAARLRAAETLSERDLQERRKDARRAAAAREAALLDTALSQRPGG
ncbi:hypothetical protein [Roseobacter weihaiensis]|uniref:hypothetical protein n=1 Tax=Roseobacter weihaiensis TaxID=2763262 RepID=UPI001D0B8EC5|nr:hypothetical protein [Roseobacter sp. H9]